jgi:hypothetical protein
MATVTHPPKKLLVKIQSLYKGKGHKIRVVTTLTTKKMEAMRSHLRTCRRVSGDMGWTTSSRSEELASAEVDSNGDGVLRSFETCVARFSFSEISEVAARSALL